MEKTWTINTVNQCTLPWQIEEIPGVNNCLYYFGAGLSYFPNCVEDEDLVSISFVCEEAAKVWYVVNLFERYGFEKAVASYMLSPEYLNEHEG